MSTINWIGVIGELKMKLYMAVTKDKYEHPIYIESKPSELAKKLNMRTDSLLRRIWRGGIFTGYIFCD